MDPTESSVSDVEQLFERLRKGLGAEWVALEPGEPTAAGDDPRRLRSSVPMADGRPGVLTAQRSSDAPAFSDAERQLFAHLAALTETVLRVAGESAQRSRRLAVSQAVSTSASNAVSVVETLSACVDAVFDNSGYYAVTATLIDHDADEQLIVADRTRALRNHTGMRRPLDEGLVGDVARTCTQQIYARATQHPDFSWPDEDAVYNSLLLTPVVVDGRCEAVLELCDTRPGAFDDSDSELMYTVAVLIAGALMRTAALEESRHRAARLAVGSAVAATLTDARSLTEALDRAVQTVFANSGYDVVAATIVLEDSQEQLLVTDLSRMSSNMVNTRRPIDAGIIGAAIQSREQILLDDAQADPRYDWPDPLPLSSLLVTPVVVNERCVAALEIWDSHEHRFDRFDAALMQHVADHLAAAWRSINLREESERRAQRLELTLEVTRGVAAASSQEGALAAAVDALTRSTTYQAMAAVLADHDRGEQMMVASHMPEEPLPAGLRRPIDAGLTGYVLASGRPLRIDDASKNSDWQSWEDEPLLCSALLMPVIVDGRCVATLELADRRPNRFSEQDMVLMATAAEQVAAALRRIGLGRESVRRADRLSLAAELARVIAEASTIEEALDLAAQTIFERANYTSAVATLVLHDSGEQLFVSDYNTDGSSYAGMRRPIGYGVFGDVILHGEPVILSNAGSHPTYAWPNDEIWESMVAVPIMDGGRCRAVLSVHEFETDRLDGDDLSLMIAVGGQVAASLRGVELRHQSERRARRLALTAEIAKRIAPAASADDALRAAAATLFDATEYGVVSVIRCHHELGEASLMVSLDRAGAAPKPDLRWQIDEGITGRTIRTGEAIRLGRATDDPDYGAFGLERLYPSLVQAPVMVDGRCEALLELADELPDQYNQDDELLMRTAADQVAAAMLGAQLRDESERRARRMEATVAVAEAMAGSGSVEDALRSAAEAISRLIACTAVTVFLADLETQEQVALVDIDLYGNDITGQRRGIEIGTTGKVFTTGRQVRIARTHDDPDFQPWVEVPSYYQSALLTPTAIDGQIPAVIGVYDDGPDRFDHQDELLMQAVAEQIGAALRRARMQSELSQRADRLERLEQRHRALLERIVFAQEEERSRVAADLHDDTVQVLSACVIALGRVRRALEKGDIAHASATLVEASDLVAGATDRTRRMTFELRPAVLWQQGLVAALQQLLDTVEAESDIRVRFDVEGTVERLDETLETIAFRSIGELTANARNHSQATELAIALSTGDGLLRATVADDGRGFDLEQALSRARLTNHLGLEAMMERIDAAGGAITIESAPGHGTVARLVLPLRPTG